jgi:hypothetical protein
MAKKSKSQLIVWKEIDRLLAAYDGGLDLGRVSESMWGGTLRLTLFNAPDRPAQSVRFHAGAGAGPHEVAKQLLADARNWLRDTNVVLMPAGYEGILYGSRSTTEEAVAAAGGKRGCR